MCGCENINKFKKGGSIELDVDLVLELDNKSDYDLVNKELSSDFYAVNPKSFELFADFENTNIDSDKIDEFEGYVSDELKKLGVKNYNFNRINKYRKGSIVSNKSYGELNAEFDKIDSQVRKLEKQYSVAITHSEEYKASMINDKLQKLREKRQVLFSQLSKFKNGGGVGNNKINRLYEKLYNVSYIDDRIYSLKDEDFTTCIQPSDNTLKYNTDIIKQIDNNVEKLKNFHSYSPMFSRYFKNNISDAKVFKNQLVKLDRIVSDLIYDVNLEKDFSNRYDKLLFVISDKISSSNEIIQKFDNGGGVEVEYNSEEDLFQHTETLPDEVRKVLDRHQEDWEATYENCENMLQELELLGYTFDYYLDAEPYNLRKLEEFKTGGGISEKGNKFQRSIIKMLNDGKNIKSYVENGYTFYYATNKSFYSGFTDEKGRQVIATNHPEHKKDSDIVFLSNEEIKKYDNGGGVSDKSYVIVAPHHPIKHSLEKVNGLLPKIGVDLKNIENKKGKLFIYNIKTKKSANDIVYFLKQTDYFNKRSIVIVVDGEYNVLRAVASGKKLMGAFPNKKPKQSQYRLVSTGHGWNIKPYAEVQKEGAKEGEFEKWELVKKPTDYYLIIRQEYTSGWETNFYQKPKNKYSNGGGIGNQNALMVMNDNKQIKHHTEELNKVVNTNTEVPAWVVSKVHRSASDLSDATHYLDGVNSEFLIGGGIDSDLSFDKNRFKQRQKAFVGYLGDTISIKIAETFLGRKINSWNDDIITIGDTKYKKVYLRPEYKQIS